MTKRVDNEKRRGEPWVHERAENMLASVRSGRRTDGVFDVRVVSLPEFVFVGPPKQVRRCRRCGA